MSRSRLPLVALVGAVGCTMQNAPAPDGAPQAASSPLRKLKDTFFPSEEQGKGGGIRALTPEERRSLLPRPIPVPEGMEAQATPAAPETPDGGTASNGGLAQDYAEQRRQQLTRERMETERFRKYGKGGGIQRSELIRGTAGAESFSLALEPPVVLKPCGEHASIGLEAASIAWNDAEVRARANYLLGRFGGPVLVEEYVGGREFYVSVVGHPLRALPVMEQTFVDLPEGYLRMRTFNAKWFTEPGLSGDAPLLARDERWRRPVPTRQPASPWRRPETVEELCVRAFRLAGGRDWGRVEFRLDAGGVPLLIDLTPNSYLAPSAPCVLAAKEAGMSYEGFLTLIAEGALARGPTGS
jgi:hypothetical protein